MFHMGWFLSYHAGTWNQPWSGEIASEWTQSDLYVGMARSLERACFDYMIIEDGSFIPDAHRGSAEDSLASGFVPKCDPMTLVSLIGQATTHIGIIATLTTTFYPPFLGARLLTTLDHLTVGRVGANLVTSHNPRTAQNYGLDEQFEHDVRYEMADEWVEVVKALWDTWEPGAVSMDESTGVFVDYRKVHRADFHGKWFSSRGPLNTLPGPQGHPVICQAGGSSAGRAFAARHAETVIAQVATVEDMKAYREDMSRRLVDAGRQPTDCKVMFVVSPVLGETDDEAQAKHTRMLGTSEQRMERRLAILSFSSGVDFSQFDPDGPIPDLAVNAARSTTAMHLGPPNGATLREALSGPPPGIDLVGTVDTVAAKMGEYMQEAEGDGYLISGPVHRRYIAEIADGLAPALKKRQMIRDHYRHDHLRDTLQEF
jgi:FMN-dependent oxidoreductase (nitrilotriacetate monooxygenase family)